METTSSRKKSWAATVVQYLPRIELLGVLRNYGTDFTSKISGDLAAGIVVAVMLVPQGLAYSTLAGLPPMYGLYASIISLLVYAPFSTSPQLAVGPVAMMSILSNAAVSMFDGASCESGIESSPECQRFIALSQELALLVGFISLMLGLFKAGYLVNFLSHPVLKGFTFAAALIIGSSQIAKVLGFKIPRHEHVYDTWADAVIGIAEGKVHLLTFILFLENMAIFYILKYLRTYLRSHPSVKRNPTLLQVVNAFPSALVVVVVNILIVSGARLDQHGVSIVGTIDAGMPPPKNVLTSRFFSDLVTLLPSAIVMAIVGFMESISVAKAMALRFGNSVDSNQELVGIGAGNFVGAFFNSFSIAGGFSRTSVNGDAGAKTPMNGIVSAIILIIVVVFLTGLFEFLPSVTLGSMIIFAVTGLVEFSTPRMLWAVDKGDFLVYIVSLIATIALGIELGIGVGAAISLARVIKEAALPHVAILGKMPGSGDKWRNIKRFPGKAKEEDGIRVLRFDSPLFFANASFFKDLILRTAAPEHADDGTATGTAPRAIVVDFSAVVNMDSSAIHMLESLPVELRKQARLRKHARVKALKARLAAAARSAGQGGSDLVGEVASLTTPKSASVEEYHPAKSLADAVPETDSGLADDPAALAERIRRVIASPPVIPVLFIACVRGPVRDMFSRNDFFEDCEEARAKFVKGNMWKCEYPCKAVCPHSLLFVGCRRVPDMPTWDEHVASSSHDGSSSSTGSSSTGEAPAKEDASSPSGSAAASAKAKDGEDDKASRSAAPVSVGGAEALHSASASAVADDAKDGQLSREESALSIRPRHTATPVEHAGELDEGPVATKAETTYPLLQMVLQEQDIGDAVRKVLSLLREFDDMAASEAAEAKV